MSKILILIIKLYQRTLSPDHGLLKYKFPYGFCRFYPTCSEYTIQALSKYGLIKGVILSARRIAKCNPFSNPQIDKI